MRKYLIVSLLLAAASLAAPAAASASATVLATTSSSLGSPALAGDRVVATVFRSANLEQLYSFAPGTPAKRLLTNRTRFEGDFAVLGYGASGQRVAAVRVGEASPGNAQFFSGPPLGPLSQVAVCGPAPENQVLVPDVDGTLAAWPGQACTKNRVLIDDAGKSTTVDAGGQVEHLAVAGRFVAWLTITAPSTWTLTVYDVDAGAPAYSVAVPPPGRLDVQADGTALITSAVNDNSCKFSSVRERLLYYTKADPTAHEVPVRSCSSEAKIANNRVAFVQQTPAGAGQLTLADLSGQSIQPVANFERSVDAETFDFDGKRIAWRQTRCRDNAILARDASDTSPPEPAVTCPVSVSRTAVLRSDGTIHVAVSCRNGCKVNPGARNEGLGVISPHWLHVRGKVKGTTQYTPFAPFDVKPGGRQTLRIRLTAGQIATLRRKGRTTARLKAVGQHVYQPSIIRTIRAR